MHSNTKTRFLWLLLISMSIFNTSVPVKADNTVSETIMFRLFNRYNGEHLYTADKNERNTLYNRGWTYEGISWISPEISDTPVYRLYNGRSGQHLYTTDVNEYNELPAKGWNQEGIAFYSDDQQEYPVYRLFNRYNGEHHFTGSINEYNILGAGKEWIQEGIAWYGTRTGSEQDTQSDDLQTGYIKNTWVDGSYVDSDGYFMKNGWLKMNGTFYHFDENGKNDSTQNTAPRIISEPGYYISPMKTGNLNSSNERIEAMISRAYDYIGTRWVACQSTRPGGAADCSGLVMQCLMAAGFDPSPATPAHHARRENEYDSRTLYYQTKMKHIPVSDIRRGDIVWYAQRGRIIHVAIYLGNGQVIDSWPPKVAVHSLHWSGYNSTIIGAARPFPG